MSDGVPGHAPSSCETLVIRGLSYNIRRWGRRGARPLLMLHGARDSSITFQFVVDRFASEWDVIAPDWRGHGLTDRANSYWLHDFVADLSAIVDHLYPARSIPIVGHSMGGNVAGIFAGLRPDRISRLVSLDGFGPLINHVRIDPVSLLRSILDGGAGKERSYPDLAAVIERLRRANGRLTPSRAAFLAEHSTRAGADGQRRWLYTSSFQRSVPTLRTLDEWGAVWAGITAPVLWVLSDDQRPNAPVRDADEMARRSSYIAQVEMRRIERTGHNLHHDEPERVARLIEDFLERQTS